MLLFFVRFVVYKRCWFYARQQNNLHQVGKSKQDLLRKVIEIRKLSVELNRTLHLIVNKFDEKKQISSARLSVAF